MLRLGTLHSLAKIICTKENLLFMAMEKEAGRKMQLHVTNWPQLFKGRII